MNISVFDLFKIGIGPSSSHTMGPMTAANDFVEYVSNQSDIKLSKVHRVRIELFGSLGATGVGHGSGPAVLLGLEANQPNDIDPDYLVGRLADIQKSNTLKFAGQQPIAFNFENDVIYTLKPLPQHANGMRFGVYSDQGKVLVEREYFSVGGGFVVDQDGIQSSDQALEDEVQVPYEFTSMQELLGHCNNNDLSIAEIMMANETVRRTEKQIRSGLLDIWYAMQGCVQRGCKQEGILPGGLKVRRRAPALYEKLVGRPETSIRDSLSTLDWVNLYALAVNEENAAGGRVVTAPTNGAAGIVPAVLHYYERFYGSANDDGIVAFLLSAAAIGMLCKRNASISGAEVGCQGEVGSACAMAAAGLAAVSGGSAEQIENAAEIAMEHNLGLTCDPVSGLVQVPCIERNAMASVKAINACRLSLRGDGHHFVSLDKVIQTMRDTGADMQSKYKETSLGGLAVSVIEC